ncbi:TPA: recombinase family protein [Escherichia coli]|nr:hypothetical protein CNQ55_26020 [Escherichia coli]EEZ9097807.1 recombinase family protein [Escherichia coli]EFB8222959.1 recombinase family protein [Escherichia coli]EGA0693048.1 recombinase family protein [Escherichia coli]EGI1120996.1 recombinase family protein [Escherichia coli]
MMYATLPRCAALTASCSSGQHFASGFLQISPRDEHPCLPLTLPLTGCVEDFHLLVVLQPPQLKNSASHGAHTLQARGVKLALGTTLYDPGDPMGKMFFNVLATFAEFEGDLIRLRTREGMAIARAKGKLRGKQPKLSDKQQKELCRMHETGQYSISDLAELFSVSRPTVYRTLLRGKND